MSQGNQTKPKRPGRGGPRAGSGRPKGALTKRTREIAEQAAVEGVTPLEVMVRTMRYLLEQATHAHETRKAARAAEEDYDGPDPLAMMVKASDVAKDAAPYMHPRLAAVEHTGKGGGPIKTEETGNVRQRSDAELLAILGALK